MKEIVINKGKLKDDEITEVLDKARIVLRNDDGEFILSHFERVYFLPGGKVEVTETPVDAVKRELLEETGYTVHSVRCHGYVTFPGLYYGEDEGMFVYSCHDFEGTLKECDEGVLEWVDDDLIPDYPQWKADYHFLNWMEDDHYHHAKVVYKNDELIEYKEEIY